MCCGLVIVVFVWLLYRQGLFPEQSLGYDPLTSRKVWLKFLSFHWEVIMDLNKQVKTIQILNIDEDESSLLSGQSLFENSTQLDENSYVLSDVDEELIILVEFKQATDVQSVKLFALSDIDFDISDSDEDPSAPKRVHVLLIDNLSKDFEDIKSMKPDKTAKCSIKSLSKGQTISLQKTTKTALKFKKTRYLAIYIESNQNDTEKTYLNGLRFQGIGPKESTHVHGNDVDSEEEFLQHLRRAYENDVALNRGNFCDGRLTNCGYLNRFTKDMNTFTDKHVCGSDDILDDHLHLLLYHNTKQDFENIYNALRKCCNIKQCKMFHRNYRNRHQHQVQDSVQNDHEHTVNRQIYDRVHCFYLHSYDIGYKMSSREDAILNAMDDDLKQDENDDNRYFVNRKTKQLYSILSKKHQLYRECSGASPINKFNALKMYNIDDAEQKEDKYSFGFDFRYGYESWKQTRMQRYFILKEKYASFKEELMNSLMITMQQFNSEYQKAQKHYDSEYAKRLQHHLDPVHKIRMENGKMKFCVNQLLSVLFYTNYDVLQYEFSKTYRKNTKKK
eukprot:904179_1